MTDHGPENSAQTQDKDLPLHSDQLIRSFDEGGRQLQVLNGVELKVGPGETVAIIGDSGSGKTTLLQLLGGLDDPTSGSVKVFGRDFAAMGDAERGRIRNRWLGFVYQFHHLLPEFTAVENVIMPLLLRKEPVEDLEARAVQLLTRVGLAGRLDHRPGELSGGERQRVAVARALVTEPAVVLADEPTGNLDQKSGQQTMELMMELNQESGASLVIVTHSAEIAARMSRVLVLEEGLLKTAGPG